MKEKSGKLDYILVIESQLQFGEKVSQMGDFYSVWW